LKFCRQSQLGWDGRHCLLNIFFDQALPNRICPFLSTFDELPDPKRFLAVREDNLYLYLNFNQEIFKKDYHRILRRILKIAYFRKKLANKKKNCPK